MFILGFIWVLRTKIYLLKANEPHKRTDTSLCQYIAEQICLAFSFVNGDIYQTPLSKVGSSQDPVSLCPAQMTSSGFLAVLLAVMFSNNYDAALSASGPLICDAIIITLIEPLNRHLSAVSTMPRLIHLCDESVCRICVCLCARVWRRVVERERERKLRISRVRSH